MLVHSDVKAFKCEICGREFREKKNMRKHWLVHTGDRPHKCEICDKTFIQSSSLKNHMKQHLNVTVKEETELNDDNSIDKQENVTVKEEITS